MEKRVLQANLSTQSRKKPPPPRERKTQSCHSSEHSLETKVILVLDLVSANAVENRELSANIKQPRSEMEKIENEVEKEYELDHNKNIAPRSISHKCHQFSDEEILDMNTGNILHYIISSLLISYVCMHVCAHPCLSGKGMIS